MAELKIDQKKWRLLAAAMRLFAKYGIDAVSLRMINREASYKNNSALHYYFGSKMRLLEELSEFVQDWFEESREAALREVELADVVTSRDILRAFIAPYIAILEQEEWGFDAVRFIARMEFDSDPEIHRILNKHAGPVVRRFKKLLRKCHPEIPRKLLYQRFNFCITSIVLGLADYKSLATSYLGDMSSSVKSLGELYIDVCSEGLGAPVET